MGTLSRASIIVAIVVGLGQTASAQVTKKLDFSVTVSPVIDGMTADVKVTATPQGFEVGTVTSRSHEANEVWQHVFESVSATGITTSTPMPGVLNDSFVVKTSARNNLVKLVDPADPSSRPQDLDSAYILTSYFNQHATEMIKISSNDKWLELVGKRGDLAKFVICVGLDFQGHVAKNIKIPLFVEHLMAVTCGDESPPLGTLQKNLKLKSVDAFVPTPDQQMDFGVNHHYVDLWYPYQPMSICSPVLIPVQSQVDDLRASGWISSNSNDPDTVLAECQAYVVKNIFAKMTASLDATLASLPLDKPISRYHRSLLQQLIAKTSRTLLLTQAEIATRTEDNIAAAIKSTDGFAPSSVSEGNLNFVAFGDAVDNGNKHTPDELMLILFTKSKGDTNSLRDDLKGMSEAAQRIYFKRLKALLSASCDYANFSPRCLFEGALSLSRHQYEVSFSSGETVVADGFILESTKDH